MRAAVGVVEVAVRLRVVVWHVEDPTRELVRCQREEFRRGGAGSVYEARRAERCDSRQGRARLVARWARRGRGRGGRVWGCGCGWEPGPGGCGRGWGRRGRRALRRFVSECDEGAAPCYRHAPIVGACAYAPGGVVGRRRGVSVCAVRQAGETVACVEHVEGSEPVRRGRRGLAG